MIFWYDFLSLFCYPTLLVYLQSQFLDRMRGKKLTLLNAYPEKDSLLDVHIVSFLI